MVATAQGSDVQDEADAPSLALACNLLYQRDCQTMANDIEDTVKSIIVEKLGVDESDVTSDASFTNDLGADSLDTVELIMEFEKEFDLTIPDEEAEDIATVGDAIDYLETKTA